MCLHKYNVVRTLSHSLTLFNLHLCIYLTNMFIVSSTTDYLFAAGETFHSLNWSPGETQRSTVVGAAAIQQLI